MNKPNEESHVYCTPKSADVVHVVMATPGLRSTLLRSPHEGVVVLLVIALGAGTLLIPFPDLSRDIVSSITAILIGTALIVFGFFVLWLLGRVTVELDLEPDTLVVCQRRWNETSWQRRLREDYFDIFRDYRVPKEKVLGVERRARTLVMTFSEPVFIGMGRHRERYEFAAFLSQSDLDRAAKILDVWLQGGSLSKLCEPTDGFEAATGASSTAGEVGNVQ